MKHLPILLGFCTLLLFSSCTDWLDVSPRDQQTEAQSFSSRAGFYAAVNGVYNNVASTTLYGKNLSYGMLEFMARRYNVTSSQTYYYNLSTFNYSDATVASAMDGIWKKAYSTIVNCNVILENLEKKKNDGILSETDYKLIKGDLMALRGFLHFDLLRMFGPIYSQNPHNKSIAYNTVTTGAVQPLLPADSLINSKLIPDLDSAEVLLSQVDPVMTKGVLASGFSGSETDNYMRYRQLRMNRYAVALLKARVYLLKEDYANALAEAQKITDSNWAKSVFPFVNSGTLLGNTSSPDRVFSSEALFGFYQSDRSTIYSENYASTLTQPLMPRTDYLGSLFTNTADYRYQSQWNASNNEFIKYKQIVQPVTDSIAFYSVFYPLMRVSEAYYIAAEALGHSNVAAGKAYLDKVLVARGLEPSTATSLTTLLVHIQREYAKETYGEGQLFFLFKRFYMGINNEFNGSKINSNNDSPSSTRYVVPLPTSEETYR